METDTEVEEETDEEEDVRTSSNSSRCKTLPIIAPVVRENTAGRMERVYTQEVNAQQKQKSTKTLLLRLVIVVVSALIHLSSAFS